MLGRLRARLTYADVMATFAVFVALGGSSYAAVKITSRDVKDNSLTTKDIKDRSLLSKDFKKGQLPGGARGQAGPQGQTGPQGPQGPAGADGSPGPTAAAVGGDYDDPPAGPTHVLEHTAITLKAPSRIYVQTSIHQASASCTFTATSNGAAGNCTMTLGIYVDGQPVPHTARAFGNSSASSGSSFNTNIQASDFDWSLFGITDTLPAGTHDIQLSGKLDPHPTNAITTGSQGPNAPNAQAIVGGIAIGS